MRSWTKDEVYVWHEAGVRQLIKAGYARDSAQHKMEKLLSHVMPEQTEQPLSAAKFAKGTLTGPLPSRFDIHGRPRN